MRVKDYLVLLRDLVIGAIIVYLIIMAWYVFDAP